MSRPGTQHGASTRQSLSRTGDRGGPVKSALGMDTTTSVSTPPRSPPPGSSMRLESSAGMTGLAAGIMQTAPDSDLHEASMEDLLKGFDKTCALCVRTFPKKALEMKVLWKHVIALRRSWDPALVPKVIEALDQSITMYNLVNVCAFCAQFFDPDFEGGIAYPQRESKAEAPTGVIGAIMAEPQPYVRFLDTRHLHSRGPPTLASASAGSPLSAAAPHSHRRWDSDFLQDGSTTSPGERSEGASSGGSSERWWTSLTRGTTPPPDDYSVLTNDSERSRTAYLKTPSVMQSRARARRTVELTRELEKSAGEAAAAKEAEQSKREREAL